MKKKVSILAAFALVATTFAFAPAAKSAEQYAIPAAPTGVTASVSSSGVMVKWNAVAAQPAITTYVVSGGQGSCPIYVSPDKGHLQTIVPVLVGQSTFTPTVQAVNVYGVGPAGTAKSISAANLAKATRNTDLKVVQLD